MQSKYTSTSNGKTSFDIFSLRIYFQFIFKNKQNILSFLICYGSYGTRMIYYFYLLNFFIFYFVLFNYFLNDLNRNMLRKTRTICLYDMTRGLREMDLGMNKSWE